MSDPLTQNEPVAPEEGAVGSPDAAEAALEETSEAERQRDEYLETLQRLQADFENYRKRVSRAAEDAATRAAGDIVAKLLPVLDAFDLAAAHFADAAGEEGVALGQARGLMLDALAREGLARVDEVDVPFDPQVHDAVAHVPHVEGEDATAAPLVVEVLRAGYLWKGAVLRPAMVKVRG